MATNAAIRDGVAESLPERYQRIRTASVALCDSLETEDFVVQSMPDASPAKWHLAHVTWFFEHFLLQPQLSGYAVFNEELNFLFNSYYYSVGAMHPRPQRGLLTRPTVATVMEYRRYVDAGVQRLLASNDDPQLQFLLELGLNHEQQHQELLLTDIKHAFFCNPMQPAIDTALAVPPSRPPAEHRFVDGPAGIHQIGAAGNGFCFDNETPRHDVVLPAHRIGSRLITNGEYLEFIRDGGYRKTTLWLSDGWAAVNTRGWDRPLYWSESLEQQFTAGGNRALDLNAPVTHVSFYEADAFARWASARLPTEAEWEMAAGPLAVAGNFLESAYWQPAAAAGHEPQFFGDTWEWTSSPYAPYPGFKPLAGSLGEYNGKFMCNQMTVRGGSCVSAADHLRATYRSFFYPDARWQFLGIRLAQDV